MGKQAQAAIFEIPSYMGAYWYYCENREKFLICDVVEIDGEMRARFTNGSFQSWCGKKSYFIGPIEEPIINENGAWK